MFENDTDRDLDELIRRSTQMELPVEVEGRLRSALDEFRTRVEQRPPSRLRSLVDSLAHARFLRMAAMTAALLVAIAAGLIFIPGMFGGSRVYAAAAAQLRSSQSIEYSVVFNADPYVGVDLSYLMPGYRRINCSWGIEVRADHTTGRQIVLFHAARTYLMEEGKQAGSLADSADLDLAEQLRSLPQTADEELGEQHAGGKRLLGFRLHKAPANSSIPGLKAFDIWVDTGTRAAHHVDITIQEPGKPVHQMHIQNIRAGAAIDRSMFDLTPPDGYTPMAIPVGPSHAAQLRPAQSGWHLRPGVSMTHELVAVVVPMHGSYQQTTAALQTVATYLKAHGVTPDGPPLGRFWSEQHWETGYPVTRKIQLDPPFQLVSLPAALTASVVVKAPWGKDSDARWGAVLKSIMEQGFLPAGPPMEIWSGEDAKPSAQSTEMRIPVTKGN